MKLAATLALALLTLACGAEPPSPPSTPPSNSNAGATEDAPPEEPKTEPPVQNAPPTPATRQYAYGLNREFDADCLDEPLAFKGTLARVFTVEPVGDGTYTVTVRFVPDTVVALIPGGTGVYQAEEAKPITLTIKPDTPTKSEVFYPITADGQPAKLGLKETVTLVVKSSDGLPYSVLADGSPGLDPAGVKLVCGTK